MKKLFALLVLLILAPALVAQSNDKGIKVFGGQSSERGETRVLFWDAGENAPVGEFVIAYGLPKWKAEYTATGAFDKMTQGQVWRLGKNFWTVLDTNLPLRVGGVEVEPGSYYLGVTRSNDGNDWHLCFIDPASAREKRLDASQIGMAEIAFKAPLRFSENKTTQETLDLTLEKSESKINRATLTIAWGTYLLQTPIVARLPQ